MSARPATVISKSLVDFNRTIFDSEVKVAGVALKTMVEEPASTLAVRGVGVIVLPIMAV